MRRLSVAVIAAASTVAVTQIAVAADLPVKAPVSRAPAIVAPAWSWTGFYLGVNAGYGWNTTTGDYFCSYAGVVGDVGCSTPVSGVVKPRGGLFGVQAGYNWQRNRIVYGIEADIQWSGIKDSASAPVQCCLPQLGESVGVFSASANLEWFGTLRGRLGFAAFDRGLIYGTGGLIYGHESVSALVAFPGGTSYSASSGSTRTGWTLGGGLEYAFTQNVTGKIEGLYYDMGSETIAYTSPITLYTANASFRYRGGIVRGGLNYKF
jgi:outer membrane immunogenic protein